MDALLSAARVGMHAQATVRRKCPAWQITKAGDIRRVKSSKKRSPNGLRFDFNDFTSGEDRIKGISPWKEKSSKKIYKRIVSIERFFTTRDTRLNQVAGSRETKINRLSDTQENTNQRIPETLILRKVSRRIFRYLKR